MATLLQRAVGTLTVPGVASPDARRN